MEHKGTVQPSNWNTKEQFNIVIGTQGHFNPKFLGTSRDYTINRILKNSQTQWDSKWNFCTKLLWSNSYNTFYSVKHFKIKQY